MNKGLKEEYRKSERIDRLVENLWEDHDPWLEYERHIHEKSPSRLQKIGRKILDTFGIKISKVEQQRDYELMGDALKQYRKERGMETEYRDAQYKLKQELRARKEEEEREWWLAEREKQQLEHDLLEGREHHDYMQQSRFENMRRQESFEKELNQCLLSVNELESRILADDPGVKKRSVFLGDKEIPVYDLCETPYTILSTTIDYKKYSVKGAIGRQTWKKIVDDPRLWMQHFNDVVKTDNYRRGGMDENSMGDTLSTSLSAFPSCRPVAFCPGGLIYGFDHVDGGSVLSADVGDMASSRYCSNDIANYPPLPWHISELVDEPRGSYNEVLLKRYSEGGKAKMPDYILTFDNYISDINKKHAVFWQIPIVNLMKLHLSVNHSDLEC